MLRSLLAIAVVTFIIPSVGRADGTASIDCTNPSRSCSVVVASRCLKRAGAGQMAVADTGCQHDFARYRDCLREVVIQCSSPARPKRSSVILEASKNRQTRSAGGADNACIELRATSQFAIELVEGLGICNGARPEQNVIVEKLSPASASFFGSHGHYSTCYTNDTCSFFWSGAPRYRIVVSQSGAITLVSLN